METANPSGLAFWHQHLGRHLSDAPIEKSSKAQVPQRLGKDDPDVLAKGKKGKRVEPWTLGAKIPVFYFVMPSHSRVIGKLALDDTAEVSFIGADSPDARRPNKLLTEWLINQAVAPFMIGMYSDANPNSSFCVSHHETLATFCDPSGNLSFNLNHLREDVKRIGDLPWTSLAPAIHRYEALRNAEPGSRAAEVAKAQLNKLLAATPVLRGLLPRLHVRAGSGEYQLLSWYFARERLPIPVSST